jgi:serine phosphatase RsbU (regulator of sigma subunit)
LVKNCRSGVLVAVVDGLGHGGEAAAAAKLAVATMEQHAEEPVITLIQRCHEALKRTRGAAMSVAHFNSAYHTLTWLGVGNVEGVLVRADSHDNPGRETIMLLGGTIGFRLPTLRATVTTVTPGDTLVFATDGIRSGFVGEVVREERPKAIADRICNRYGKGTDDALVLVARYLGGGA